MPPYPMSDQVHAQSLDLFFAIVAVVCLVVGLLSVLIGKIAAWYTALCKSFGQDSDPIDTAVMLSRAPPTRTDEGGINILVSKPVSVSGTDTAPFDVASIPSDLTYEEVVTILAGQVTSAGKPTYSGKRIYTLVGGNYNEFTALMRRLRAKDGGAAEPPPTMTPIAGRPTRATFKETDPELAYTPPE